MTILSEAWHQGDLDKSPPTHIFLQVGVGTFSGGMSGYLVNKIQGGIHKPCRQREANMVKKSL